MFCLDFLTAIIGVLLSVAFFTLIERNVMGLIHYRKGPNNVILAGISQPITDAVKLLTNEFPNFSNINIVIYFLGPTISLALMFLYWTWYEYSFNCSSSPINIIIILAVISLTAYGFILTSWGSNSKYALIGGHRAVAQIISYEVCIVLYILVVIYSVNVFSIENINSIQQGVWLAIVSLPLFLSWVILCIAETNRTPFDLAEGESEIVSGFNIEYGGGLFAFIFISEYGIIMFIGFLTSLLFLGSSNILANTLLISLVFVWSRSSFPRVRYDNLIIMAWKISLPYSLVIIILSSCVL